MTWGLVLSGGGACGLANVGVVEALSASGLEPDCVAGSSMGAIVASLYALGVSPDVYPRLINGLQMSNAARLSANPFKDGLHGGLLRQQLREHLEPYLGDATIADCKIPFLCVAGAVREPIPWARVFSGFWSGSLFDAIELTALPTSTALIDATLASSAMPVIFSPVEIQGVSYIDAVRFGAIPARALHERHRPRVLIATDTSVSGGWLERLAPRPLRTFLRRGAEMLAEERAACDLVIRPRPAALAFRFDRGEDFRRAGREAAETVAESIHNLLCGQLDHRKPLGNRK